jgi:two-component system, cell cycle response regulator
MTRPRVLVVDDSELARALLTRALSRAHFEVLEARDGAEGAVLALQECPDAVVTDLEMPVMDGYQLLHLLKSDPAGSQIPVLILTSHDEAASRYWGLHTGADAYLTKDRAAEDLVGTVRRLIEQSRHVGGTPRLDPPQGPMDVLARVARHLDAGLLQATLVSSLLEEGMGAEALHDACRIALQKVNQIVDAWFLAIGIAEPETVTLDLLLPERLSHRTVDGCTSALLANLRVTAGATIDVLITGERDAGPDLDWGTMLFLPLAMRNCAGTLALLPREPNRFETSARKLVEGLVPHLGLLLDNARLAQRLRELSTLDGLTRLLNHRAIHDRLAEEVSRSLRYAHPLSVILCDLDHFKRVNDSHGHLVGDAALRVAAQALKSCLRGADSLGRYGGEEFLVVLPETGLDASLQAAERLRRRLASRALPVGDGDPLRLTGSFGVATLVELGLEATADGLVSLADTRLYEAKAAGRNCVRP